MKASQLQPAPSGRGVVPNADPRPLNDARGFFSCGQVEVSGDDAGWTADGDARVFRAEVGLGDYLPKVRPAVALGVVKLDAGADAAWEVAVEPSAVRPDALNRFSIVIRLRGERLRAIGVQWTAWSFDRPGSGG